MFGLGISEIIMILGVALLVLGPEKLPELARTIGKTMAELRRTMDEVRREVNLSTIDETPPTPRNLNAGNLKSEVETKEATEIKDKEQG